MSKERKWLYLQDAGAVSGGGDSSQVALQSRRHRLAPSRRYHNLGRSLSLLTRLHYRIMHRYSPKSKPGLGPLTHKRDMS